MHFRNMTLSSIPRIFVVGMNPLMDDTVFRTLLPMVSEQKQDRIKRFLKPEDAQRCLIGDLLVRFLIIENLSISNRDIRFETNQYGKPFLAGVSSFHFNIAHSGNWIVCAVHDLSVGVDVEKIKPIELDIAKRFFSAEEYHAIVSQPIERQLDYFFSLWTLKESYIKAVGKGLSLSLDTFSIQIVPDGRIEVHDPSQERLYLFKQFKLDDDHKLALCYECRRESMDDIDKIDQADNKLCYLSIADLYSFFSKLARTRS